MQFYETKKLGITIFWREKNLNQPCLLHKYKVNPLQTD